MGEVKVPERLYIMVCNYKIWDRTYTKWAGVYSTKEECLKAIEEKNKRKTDFETKYYCKEINHGEYSSKSSYN